MDMAGRSRNLVLVIGLALGTQAFGHHSRANFDETKELELTGTVTEFTWRNPHVYLEIDVKNESGSVDSWLVESHSVTSMQRFGWSRDSLKPGDPITVTVQPDRDPTKKFALMEYMLTPDGERLYAFQDNRTREEPRIEPSTDFAGTWYAVRSAEDIRLAGGGPPADWPLTEMGRQNVRDYDEHESPQYDCLPVGVPKMTFYSYAINFKRDGDVVRIDKEHLNEHRTIYLDKDPGELEGAAPSYVGTSTGRLGSDGELIVETDNFLPTKWGLANGIDSSDQKHMTERYRLTEDGMFVDVSYTLTDPVYLLAPVTVTGQYRKAESREFTPVPCDPDTARRHLSRD